MHTRTWLTWLLAALLVVGLTTNPLYMLLALLAATLVFQACHGETPLARAYRLFFMAGFALWIGYVVFSVITVGGARGVTVLFRLPMLTLPAWLGGITLGGPITAEDIAWGAVRGMRVWALMAIFGAFNALVNHYRLLRLAPRSLFHAGLAVTIAVAFVPQTLRSISQIVEAQRVRGHRFRGPRTYLPLVAPLLAGSLETSIQLAEALDARGYGRTRADDVRLGRRQLAVIVGLLLVGIGVFGWLYYGAGGEPVPIGTIAAVVGVAGAAVLAAAMVSLGRLVTRTTYRRERWRRRDTAVCAAAALCVAGWIALRLAGALGYNPYPLITLPRFDPFAGALVLLLAVPALFGPARDEERRQVRGRIPRRDDTAREQQEANAKSRPIGFERRAP